MKNDTWFAAAQHELIRARRSRTLRVALLLVSVLLGAGFLLEAQRQAADAHQQQALQEQVSEQFKSQPDRHPHRMAHYGSFAFRPPGPLAFFDPGLTPFTGNVLYLEAHKRNFPSFSAAAASGELARFGRTTAAFVLQLLLPLLIFMSAFDSIAGEREAGTWQLALSHGARVGDLFFGKVLGQVALALLWVLPAILLAALARALFGGWAGSADTWLRSGLLLLGYAGYLALCAVIGVLVSSLYRSSQKALVTLLCVWIVAWVVVPRTATELAVRAHPMPARSQIESDISRAVHGVDNGHGASSPAAKALTARTLAQYGVPRIEDLPVNINGLRAQAGEERTSHLYDRYYASLYELQRAQVAYTLRFGALSPLLLLRSLSMALSGSDAEHYADFLERAEAHRLGFITRLNDVHAKHLQYEKADNGQRASHEHWADYRHFDYSEPTLARSGVLLPLSAAGLLAICLVLAALARLVARKELM